MKRTKRTEHVRVKLGISQLDLADYLGVPRSQLSMYELNQRYLPRAARDKLAKLELIHNDMQQGKLQMKKSSESHHSIKSHHEKINREMQLLVENSGYKKLLLERRLKIMKTAYEKIAVWAPLMDHLVAVTAEESKDEGDLLWLKKQQRQLAKKEIRYGKAVQALTEAKIAVLEKEIEVYTQVLNTIG